MSLDDFTTDEDVTENAHLDDGLKQEEPPDDSDTWPEYEPGVPDWLGFIESEDYKVSDEDVHDSNTLTRSGEGIKIMITGVDSTSIVCTNPKDLTNCR